MKTQGKVVSTQGENVISNQPEFASSALAPCDHEEADSRIVTYILKEGFKKIPIYTVDSDTIFRC